MLRGHCFLFSFVESAVPSVGNGLPHTGAVDHLPQGECKVWGPPLSRAPPAAPYHLPSPSPATLGTGACPADTCCLSENNKNRVVESRFGYFEV